MGQGSKRALNENFLAGEFFSRDRLVLFLMVSRGKSEKKITHFMLLESLISFKNDLNLYRQYIYLYIRTIKNL